MRFAGRLARLMATSPFGNRQPRRTSCTFCEECGAGPGHPGALVPTAALSHFSHSSHFSHFSGLLGCALTEGMPHGRIVPDAQLPSHR
jgi:hypothetical protein